MSVIDTNQLTKKYGHRIGIERLTFSVDEGEVFGFLGPNGAGKTTAIRVLLGLLRQNEGSARIFGRDCWKESHHIKVDVGFTPGDLRCYLWMTALDAIDIFGRIRGLDLIKAGTELAERYKLELGVKVRNMSKGMRQKLGLILSLVHKPQLLILDEPTTALDPLMQDELYRHLRQLANEGHTVFFSSHTLSEVEQLCDRVAILREGKLVADTALEALREQAHRSITIQWNQGAEKPDGSLPEYLDFHDRSQHEWHGTLKGSTPQFIEWLHGKPFKDVSISKPNLEVLFRRYYQ